MKVKRLSRFTNVADQVMRPVMFALGGFKQDSIQETHFWHNQAIDRSEIDESLTVLIHGDDNHARIRTNRVFPIPMFHIPILGGWRNYVVLRVGGDVPYWHIGWMHRTCAPGSRLLATVQRLRITDRDVKVLTQSVGFVTEFFAFAPSGEQLPVSVVDRGKLGDMKHPMVRLM